MPARNLATSTSGVARPANSAATAQPSKDERRANALRAAESRAQGPSQPTSVAHNVSVSTKVPELSEARQPAVAVLQMEALMHLVHCVFLAQGCIATEQDMEAQTRHAPRRITYSHSGGEVISAVYVPVQRHLMLYASFANTSDAPGRAKLQLGMTPESVQVKVEYLVVNPLLCRRCVPVLSSLPP